MQDIFDNSESRITDPLLVPGEQPASQLPAPALTAPAPVSPPAPNLTGEGAITEPVSPLEANLAGGEALTLPEKPKPAIVEREQPINTTPSMPPLIESDADAWEAATALTALPPTSIFRTSISDALADYQTRRIMEDYRDPIEQEHRKKLTETFDNVDALARDWTQEPQARARALKAFGQDFITRYEQSTEDGRAFLCGMKLLEELYTRPGDDEFAPLMRFMNATGTSGLKGAADAWRHFQTMQTPLHAEENRLRALAASTFEKASPVIERMLAGDTLFTAMQSVPDLTPEERGFLLENCHAETDFGRSLQHLREFMDENKLTMTLSEDAIRKRMSTLDGQLNYTRQTAGMRGGFLTGELTSETVRNERYTKDELRARAIEELTEEISLTDDAIIPFARAIVKLKQKDPEAYRMLGGLYQLHANRERNEGIAFVSPFAKTMRNMLESSADFLLSGFIGEVDEDAGDTVSVETPLNPTSFPVIVVRNKNGTPVHRRRSPELMAEINTLRAIQQEIAESPDGASWWRERFDGLGRLSAQTTYFLATRGFGTFTASTNDRYDELIAAGHSPLEAILRGAATGGVEVLVERLGGEFFGRNLRWLAGKFPGMQKVTGYFGGASDMFRRGMYRSAATRFGAYTLGAGATEWSEELITPTLQMPLDAGIAWLFDSKDGMSWADWRKQINAVCEPNLMFEMWLMGGIFGAAQLPSMAREAQISRIGAPAIQAITRSTAERAQEIADIINPADKLTAIMEEATTNGTSPQEQVKRFNDAVGAWARDLSGIKAMEAYQAQVELGALPRIEEQPDGTVLLYDKEASPDGRMVELPPRKTTRKEAAKELMAKMESEIALQMEFIQGNLITRATIESVKGSGKFIFEKMTKTETMETIRQRATAARLRISEGANPDDTIVGDPALSPHMTLQQQIDLESAAETRMGVAKAQGAKVSEFRSNAYRVSLDRSRHLIRYVEGKITFDNFMEEMLESYIMEHLFDSGHTLDWYAGHLREAQKLLTERGILKDGQKLIREEGEVAVMDVVEAMGFLARADVYARIDSLRLPQFIKDFLKWCRTLISYVAHMAELGKAVRELADAGKLDKDFVQTIYDAAGITQEWWADAAMDSTHQTLANIATAAVQGLQLRDGIIDTAAAAWDTAGQQDEPTAPEERPESPTDLVPGADDPHDGEPGTPAAAGEYGNIHYVAVADLTLSPDVPQFKEGADAETGEVEPFESFDERVAPPIHVWRRLDGRLEVISGRHRFQARKRDGGKTIMAYIHDEAAGFTKKDAAALDATLNIKEGQGSVLDWARYVRDSGMTMEEARAKGLLRGRGRLGITIGLQASDDLFSRFSSGSIDEKVAAAIASFPDHNLQRAGMRCADKGMKDTEIIGVLHILQQQQGKSDTGGDMGDLFGANDDALNTAERIGQFAAAMQQKIRDRLNAIRGAAKRPDTARKLGIDITDPAALGRKVAELNAQLRTWQEFYRYPELMAQAAAWDGNPDTLANIEPAVAIDLSGGNGGMSASMEEQRISFSIADAREQGIMQDGKLEAANGTLYDMGGASFSILARHASPHSGIRKFLMQFIGTGEGAQAYGHGLYFSTSEGVHQNYVRQFTMGDRSETRGFFKDGTQVMPNSSLHKFLSHHNHRDPDKIKRWLPGHLKREAQRISDRIYYAKKHGNEAIIQSLVNELDDVFKAENELDGLGRIEVEVVPGEPSAEYEVMLNFDRNGENLLRWDEPVPESLWEKVKGLCYSSARKPATGEGLYADLQEGLGSKADATRALVSAGIKGIEYRDGSSRGLEDGVTYNYVVFREKDVKIIRYKDATSGYEWQDYIDDTASFSLVGEHAANWEAIKHLAFIGRDDGRLRVEMDASQARIKPEVAARILRRMAGDRSERKVTFRLSDILDYPALFAAYPKLAKMGVFLSDLGARGTRAWYNRGSRNIRINTLNFTLENWDAEALRSTLLHEVQHAIQHIEGFANGSGGSNWDEYIRSAGEIEARAVQKRRNMTAEERAANPLNDMLEFPGEALANINPPAIEVPFNLVTGAFEQEWGALQRSGNKAHMAFVQSLINALNKDAERLARYQTLAEDERGDMAVTLLRATNLAKTAVMYLPKDWRIDLKPYLDWMEVFAEVAHHGTMDWSSTAVAPFWEQRMREHLKKMEMTFGWATGDADQAMALLKDYGETRLFMLVNKLLKRVSGQLEEYGKGKLRDNIAALLETIAPKLKDNRRTKRGVISYDAFQEIARLNRLMQMDEEEYHKEHDALTTELATLAAAEAGSDTALASQERKEAIGAKLMELEVYGCIGMKSIDELDRLLTCLTRHIRGEKAAWQAAIEERQERRRAIAEGIIAGVKERKGEEALEYSSVAQAHDERKASGKRKGFFRRLGIGLQTIESMPQLLAVLAKHKDTAALAENIRLRLAMAGGKIGIQDKHFNKLFRNWAAQAFGIDTNDRLSNFALDKALADFNRSKDTGIRLSDYKKKNLRLPLDLALMRALGEDTAALRDELAAKLADLQDRLAEQMADKTGSLETDKAIKETEKRLAALDMEMDEQDLQVLRDWFLATPAARRAAEILRKPAEERTPDELSVINKTFKARHADITYNRFLREQKTNLQLSQNAALYIVLAYEQEDNRARMESQGWTPDIIERLRTFIGAAGLKLGESMRHHLNTSQRERIARIFERENGVPFANIPNYFPLRFQIDADKLADFDMAQMLAGMGGTGGGSVTGFLAARTDNHQLKLAMNLGATAVWRDAVATSEYWMATQDILADLRSVLGHEGVLDALTVQFGKNTTILLSQWVKALERMGRMDNNARSQIDAVTAQAYNAGAVAILAYKVETLIRQLSGIANMWAGDNTLTFGDWMRGLAATKSGKGGITLAKMLKSDYIKSRTITGHDIAGSRIARMGTDQDFTMFERMAHLGMVPLGVLDAATNAVPATVLFNAHFARAKAEPNPDGTARTNAEAREIAWAYTLAAFEQGAQPVNPLQKSHFAAVLAAVPMGRAFTFMLSENFNKLGLVHSLARQGRIGKAAGVWLTYGAINSAIGALLDAMRDDPEEWEERDMMGYIWSALFGMLGGIPIISEGLEYLLKLCGANVYLGSSGRGLIDARSGIRGVKKLWNMATDDEEHDTEEWIKETSRLMRTFGIIGGACGGTLGGFLLFISGMMNPAKSLSQTANSALGHALNPFTDNE